MENSDNPFKKTDSQRKRRASSEPPSPRGGKRAMDTDVITLSDSTSSDSSVDKQEHAVDTFSDDDDVKVVKVIPSPIVPIQPPGISAPSAPPGIRGVPFSRANIHNTASANVATQALPVRPATRHTSPLRVTTHDSLEGSSRAPSMATRRPTVDDFFEEVFPSNRIPPPVASRTTIGSSASTSDLPSRPTTSSTMISPPSFSPPPLPTTHQNTVSSETNEAVLAAVEEDECRSPVQDSTKD